MNAGARIWPPTKKISLPSARPARKGAADEMRPGRGRGRPPGARFRGDPRQQPRRLRELLDAAGVKFTAVSPVTPVDESLEPGWLPPIRKKAAKPSPSATDEGRRVGALRGLHGDAYRHRLPIPWSCSMAWDLRQARVAPQTASTCCVSCPGPHPRGHHAAVSVWMVDAPQRRGRVFGLR